MGSNDNERIWSGASPAEVAADLGPLVDFQGEGLSIDALSALVERNLVPHLIRYDVPTFLSLFNAFPEEGAAYGARVALDWNQGVTNWQVSPGGAVLEELCCDAIGRLFGLADGFEGTVMYSGTYANQQALYMALHRHAEKSGFDFADVGLGGFDDPGRLAVVASADAHFSLRHAARVLGLGEQAIVSVEVDANRRMSTTALRQTLAELGGARDVFCVVATTGTTATGSVDPVGEVVEICEPCGAWVHADGAYGLAYMLVPEFSHLYAGIEAADSVSWDPHKQLGVPIPSSLLFARRGEDLERMAIFSDYFNRPDTSEPNPGIKSVPSTRPLAALPLVASIRHQGLDGVVERLRTPLEVIRDVYDELVAMPDMEPMHRPDTGLLCFRAVPGGVGAEKVNELQTCVYEAILQGGTHSISTTVLDGNNALRLVALSPSLTLHVVMDTIAEVRRVAATFA
jgi:L-2,4-diaminobutyrate decarboxylase